MAANIEKIKICFRAIGLFLKNLLTMQFPLWLYIVAFLVCVLFSLLVACTAQKAMSNNQSAVVGYTDYRGHNYLVFSANGSFSVVHDPDCVCNLID